MTSFSLCYYTPAPGASLVCWEGERRQNPATRQPTSLVGRRHHQRPRRRGPRYARPTFSPATPNPEPRSATTEPRDLDRDAAYFLTAYVAVI